MSTPALTLITSSETPAVQDCWLQTIHPGLVCACSGPPSPPGTSEPVFTQDRGLTNMSLPHFNENWLAGVKRCSTNTARTHSALSCSHKTWDWHQTQPKSLELAQPGKEKSVKSSNPWEMSLPELLGFLTSSTLIPKWSIFQGKIKKNLWHWSPTKNE